MIRAAARALWRAAAGSGLLFSLVMPLGSSAHIDYALRSAGDVVTYSGQSGYGILDSPNLDVVDQTQMRLRGYARDIVIREGAFTGLAEDATIIFAGVPYVIRDVGNAGADGLRRLAVTRATPVFSIVVSPSSVLLVTSGTTQLTATLYDVQNNVLTGRQVVWSSSNPSIATVSATGLVTAVSIGHCLITVTSEGVSTIVTASIAIAITPLFDWLATSGAEIVSPLACVPDGGTQHLSLGMPYWLSIFDNGIRHQYPRGDGTWRQTSTTMQPGTQNNVGFGSNCTVTSNYTNGPAPASLADRVVLPDYTTGGSTFGNLQLFALSPMDQDAATDYKTSTVVAIKGTDPTQNGKVLIFERIRRSDSTILQSFPITITNTWQYISIDDRTFADSTDTKFVFDAPNDATRARDVLVYAWTAILNRTPARPEEYVRPGFWDERYGALTENPTQNCWWPSDDPSLAGGGTKSTTAVLTPDAGDYYAANYYRDVQLLAANGNALSTTNAKRVGRFSSQVPNTAAGEPSVPINKTPDEATTIPAMLWIGCYVNAGQYLPANGELVASAQVSGAAETTPVAMVKDDALAPTTQPDGSTFYSARVQVTLPSIAIASGAPSGPNYVFTTSGAHGLSVDVVVAVRGHSNAAANADWIITANTPTTFTVALSTGSSGSGGAATPMTIQPYIRNSTGTTRTLRVTRCFMLCEGLGDYRNQGWRDAWVPRRAVAGPAYNGGVFPSCYDISKSITRLEGWFASRHRLPYAIGDMIAMGMDYQTLITKRDFWQSGEYGSANHSFEGTITPNLDGDGTIALTFKMDNGNGYDGWVVKVKIPAGSQYLPKFQYIDIAVAWKAGVVVAFGIGTGAGSAAMTWLNNGDLYLGNPVSITHTPGTAWGLLDGGDAHIGLGADRDKTGLHNGHVTYVAAHNSVDPLTIQDSIAAHIAARAGLR